MSLANRSPFSHSVRDLPELGAIPGAFWPGIGTPSLRFAVKASTAGIEVLGENSQRNRAVRRRALRRRVAALLEGSTQGIERPQHSGRRARTAYYVKLSAGLESLKRKIAAATRS